MKARVPFSPLLANIIFASIILVMVAARVIPAYWDLPNRTTVLMLLGAYTLFFVIELAFRKNLRRFEPAYFIVQIGLVTALSLQRPFEDVSSALYLALVAQSSHVLKDKSSYVWWSIFGGMTAFTLILGSGWLEGIPLALYFLVAGFFVISFDLTYQAARREQEESERLLAELEQAHHKLEEQSSQSAELAAARERNRLARELHDSVSQVIFSITLNAQSARMLLERDPSKVSYLLDRLQALTSGVLEQLRSLISQLHPPSKSK
jgi:signal transduction histidine kinase